MTRNEENRNGTYRGAVGKVGSVISALYSAEKRENSQCWKWVKGQMHFSAAATHTHTHTVIIVMCAVCATGSELRAALLNNFCSLLVFVITFYCSCYVDIGYYTVPNTASYLNIAYIIY